MSYDPEFEARVKAGEINSDNLPKAKKMKGAKEHMGPAMGKGDLGQPAAKVRGRSNGRAK